MLKKNDKIIYTYQFRNNMSSIQGWFKVLYDMQYPDEILKKLETTDSFD